MPPGPTAPCSLAGLLAAFRPCFTAPTFQTFVGLVVGLIAQTRRRTVCGMLTGAGLDQVWHHGRAHRLFSNARWSGDALGLALADLIVARLLPADSALTIAVDDTLFKRSGKKVFGVAWHHDGAAKGPKPIGFGNCWVVAGIIVQLPFLSRPVCLPVLARLWRPRHTGKIAHARQLAELIAARYPNRTVHVVGDAAYVGERLRDVDARITWTSRLKLTSVLHELPPPRTGRSGRPRTRGARLAPRPTWPPWPQSGRGGARRGSAAMGAPTPYRSPNWHVSGTARSAAEPYASFWSATTSPGLEAVMTAVMDFRWSPPISNRPQKTWWPAMQHGGASNRHSPTPARSSVWARPAIGHAAPWNERCPLGCSVSASSASGTPFTDTPPDVTGHRARWYTTKTEPSYDDMAVKLRRVIIAARFRSPRPEQATPQETRAVLAAWAAAGT
jgi:hypothetical protein